MLSFLRVLNFVSHIKLRTQAESVRDEGVEDNIWYIWGGSDGRIEIIT